MITLRHGDAIGTGYTARQVSLVIRVKLRELQCLFQSESRVSMLHVSMESP